MLIAGIKHKRNGSNTYYFLVPDSISSDARVGSHVVCFTSKGRYGGEIVYINDVNKLSYDELMTLTNGRSGHELKHVNAIEVYADVRNLRLPRTPSNYQLNKYMEETSKNPVNKIPVLYAELEGENVVLSGSVEVRASQVTENNIISCWKVDPNINNGKLKARTVDQIVKAVRDYIDKM